MSDLTRYDVHAGLVDRMADKLGIDISEQTQRGKMTDQEFGRSVARCLGCTDVAACEAWLEIQQGQADAPPPYCRNAGLFADMGGD